MKIKNGKIKAHKIFIKYRKNSTVCVNCRKLIKRVVSAALLYEKVGLPCVVSVLVTDDAGIRDYNYEYRGVDKATDVLSFPMQAFRQAGWSGIENPVFDEETRELPLGDIIVSLETVKRHAIEYRKTIKHETVYMLVHSTLHLLGYNHDDECGERIMNDRSRVILSKITRLSQSSGEDVL